MRANPRGSVRGQSRAARQLARPDAHRIRRSPALHRHLFQSLPRTLFHRRRRAPRRGRLLLDHRPRGRCDQRGRTSARYGRDRERPGRSSASRRSGGGRLPARHQGPGHLRLRDADRRRQSRASRCGASFSDWVRKEISPIATPDVIQWAPGLPEDALRQDHAAHSAQDRGERIRSAGRHLDARRSRRRQAADRGARPLGAPRRKT